MQTLNLVPGKLPGLSTILLVLLIHNSNFAQQYYVNFSGDTIPGKVLINTYQDNSEQMEFKNPYNNRIILTPYNCSAVHYSKKTHYHSVLFLNERLFMEVVYTGNLSVYYYQRFNLNNGSDLTSYILTKKDGSTVEVNRFNYKNTLVDFLSDCPDLQAKVYSKKYKYNDLKEIAREYEPCGEEFNSEGISVETAIDRFRASVNKSTAKLQTTDINSMLDDIAARAKSKDKIPDYLWTSLEALVQEDVDLKKKVPVLKKQLGYE